MRRLRLGRRERLTLVALGAVVLLAAAYLLWVGSARWHRPPAALGKVSGDLLVVDLAGGSDTVEAVRLDQPAAPAATSLHCQRIHVAGGTTVCLRLAGVGPSYAADVIDEDGTTLRSVVLPGLPSRARVSASGEVVSWTSFVTGDSYSVPGGFSTRTGFLNLRTGDTVESLETFTARVDGAPFTAGDVNYWGLTVARDDRTFYATLASGGRTWLVRGDLVDRTVVSLRHDAECPSLSPDGTRVAYKKRIGRFGPWDLAVLDLATGVERRLPGTAGIDDQALWLDADRLAFAGTPRGSRLPAVHVVPADGSQDARVVVPDATSPSPLE